jgi:hypothetical protein
MFWIVVFSAVAVLMLRIYYRVTDDFRLSNITYELPHHKEWEISPINEEEKSHLNKILSQNFYYLGKGSQCYAFSSQDDQYVIKFFKFKHLKPHGFVELLPPIPLFSKYRSQQTTRKQRKLHGLFDGYRLAYEVYRQNSGLIYIHLNTTKNTHNILTVYDKIGLRRNIDLDEVVFLVQKKGITTRNVLFEDLNSHNLSAAKKHVRKILDLYANEYEMGIYDKDHGVLHNTGFIDEEPFHLDVGKLIRNESLKNKEAALKDMNIISDKFKEWIKLHYPEYYTELSEDFDAKVKSLYGP